MTDIELLHLQIGQCRQCANICPTNKNGNLKRGASSKIMIIGLSPGNVENKSGYAFSGNAGTRLFTWLQKAEIGENESEIRQKLYFTSVVKCQQNNISLLYKMYRNCEPFLKQQIELVKPKIVITLGATVYNLIFHTKYQNSDIVGTYNLHNEINTSPLFPEMDTLYGVEYILPFPHPSGLSRWLNSNENRKILNKAIALLKSKYNET